MYIGETINLRRKLLPTVTDGKYDCAKRRGITHIHVHANLNGEPARRSEQEDLIRRYRPACNE